MVQGKVPRGKKRTKLRISEYTRKKDAKKHIKKETSSSSFSTSPFAEFFTTSSSLDSVSIVSAPWTTFSDQSWNFDQFEEESKTSSYFLKWQTQSDTTLSSPDPRPTTSSGRPSPDISASRVTVTMLSCPGSFTDSTAVIVNQTSQPNSPVGLFQDIDGLSVWTIESFTSSGSVSTRRFSQLIHVKYPWSPDTYSGVSNTSDYPSSVSLLQYFGPSRDSLKTVRCVRSADTLQRSRLGLDIQALDLCLDGVKIKKSKIPLGYIPITSKV